jgi:deoxyhypusine synthase
MGESDMARRLHDGRKDGLTPLESLDPLTIDSFSGLLRAMSKTAFAGRQLGEAFEILVEMINDPDCTVVLTLSGAMTVAKQGLLITRMIQAGMINIIVSTGALITHGLVENAGLVHYKSNQDMNDEELHSRGYNRIYDTLEMEKNLNETAGIVFAAVELIENIHGKSGYSSEDITRAIGVILSHKGFSDGILCAALEKSVPVFIPAFTDSEMGLDVGAWALWNGANPSKGRDHDSIGGDLFRYPNFNPYRDLNSYARHIKNAKKLGIFTIGGGVPRNWAQQVAPYVDFLVETYGFEQRIPKFIYGVRICPEPTHFGGLSGCTYSEGISWGKFIPSSEGGRYAEVYVDATTVLPLLVKGIFEECQIII